MKTLKNMFLEFCKEWLRQSENCTNEDFKDAGLCYNFRKYCFSKNHEEFVFANTFLRKLFESKGLCGAFPFGEDEYDMCFDELTMLEDPKRKQFVLDYIKENS